MDPHDPPLADTIEKRRKQIEKAKAAHLSRQLQTRLQYARLKVDHGWQKQTLNEVENLYFHHYRARISPKGTQKPEKGVASISLQVTAELPTTASNSTFTATPALAIDTCTDQQQEQLPLDGDQTITITAAGEKNSSAMEVDQLPEHYGSSTAQTAQMTSDVQRSQSHLPVSEFVVIASTSSHSTPVSKTPSPSKPSQPPLNPSPSPHVQHRAAHSPVSHSLSSGPLVNVSPSLSRNLPLTKHPSLPQSAVPRLRGPTPAIRLSHSTPPPSMPGSSNIALTYDNFWSSHSTTSTNYRSTMTSTASFNKGDTGSELPNLEASYAFSMGASNPPFEPLPLQKQQSLSRKPAVTALRQTYSRSMGDG